MNKDIKALFIQRLVGLNNVGIHSDITEMILQSFDVNAIKKLRSKGLVRIQRDRYLLTEKGFDTLIMQG